MTRMDETHVYQRDIQVEKRSSLSVLVGMIEHGSAVLDVGIGGGALGTYLRDHKACVVDGITYNADEAAIAGTAYREVKVADLDAVRINELFGDRRYRAIVCADVLEHLRDPALVLKAARAMLEPDGRVLISVPNVAYLGLIGELLGGEFRYRHEGLLDQTHVRFFTHRSLLRFLTDLGWRVDRLERVELDLADSEFVPALDAMPPGVREQLLSNPEGLTYQFVAEVSPVSDGAQVEAPETGGSLANPLAHYALQLYYADQDGFGEDRKIEARARIGTDRQVVVFPLPRATFSGLRLDPADRPGAMHLYGIELRDAAGSVLWCWDGGVESLQHACSQVVVSPAWLGASGGALLFVGSDPHLILPIPERLLDQASGGELSVILSWPMSADFRVLAEGAAAAIARSEERASLAEAGAAAAMREQAVEVNWLKEYVSGVEVNSRKLGADHEFLHHEHVRTRRELIQMADRLSDAEWAARQAESQRDEIARHIDAIQNSTVFRLTRPLVKGKMVVDSLRERLGRRERADAASRNLPCSPSSAPVDVIVPVYRGLSDTRCCVESVLSSSVQTAFRLVLINDCSPEPEVSAYLRTLPTRDARVLLLENEQNLGFVGTVNRGMALDGARDVLLLNSDAEVANDWLDRIRAAAYSGSRVSSVTPLSNNATICSYPKFCADNEVPEGWTTASLDQLCAQTNPEERVDVPTGVGFCMYIRRDSLADVGLFDVENFGKGYGEENDFCVRAIKRGWRHLLTLDTFVRHAGGVSFGEAKTPREREAVEKLRLLHPEYDAIVHQHVAEDPARVARLRLDLARIRQAGLPAVLAITHSRGGGTERHVQELADLLADKLNSFALRPMPSGVTELAWLRRGEAFKLAFSLPADFPDLIEALRALGIAHVHIHHVIGHDPCVWGIAARLGVRYDYTVHDYYAVCPQISLTESTNRYCGELGEEQCRACLKRTPAPGRVSIGAWRAPFSQLLAGARYVFAPSQDAASRIAGYVPAAAVRAVPHNDIAGETAQPDPQPIGDRPLRVVVIGAMSPIKGADILEETARLASTSQAGVEFHLLGYGYRPLATQPKARLTVHGAYDEKDLGALLDWLKPDLVWFPALWPETYSYTLSACLSAALPVVVPDIGALPERIAGRPWSWVKAWSARPDEWLAFFEELRMRHFATASRPSLAAGTPAPATPAFEYRQDYLVAIQPRALVPGLTDVFVRRHADLLPDGWAGAELRAKGRVLSALIRARNLPFMRGVTRWVPLGLQTRAKFWLLKR